MSHHGTSSDWIKSSTALCRFFCSLVATAGITVGIGMAGEEDYELEPILYSDSTPTDRVAQMVADYESGALSFGNGGDKAFLEKVLEHLKVPIASQVLVFSRTSLQNDRIHPETPRAIYFSDDCYVGWVQGGDIEIVAVDRKLGPVFYRMGLPRAGHLEPQLYRDRDCMNCHGGSNTGGVPGMTVRSVYTDSRGFPILGAGTFRTDHTSPISERWGGWYVTGSHAGLRHMGNQIFQETEPGSVALAADYGVNLKNLDSIIDTSKYLAPTSDIVALMVLEHQITVHNAITRAHFHTERWIHQNAVMAKHFGNPEGTLSDSTRRLVKNEAARLLQALLFVEEMPLEDWGVEGNREFQEQFLRSAKTTSSGQSLREFHLMSRLFKNRLSYMIYSPAFDHLPDPFKAVFFPLLWETLQGRGSKELFQHIPESERLRIKAILRESADALPGLDNAIEASDG
ncbi:MAG: hypothetical protein O3C21_12355 [Verrucomicrobia bacterium]|nr:hypothetical protein [Verrucomicrobiota bacterium]